MASRSSNCGRLEYCKRWDSFLHASFLRLQYDAKTVQRLQRNVLPDSNPYPSHNVPFDHLSNTCIFESSKASPRLLEILFGGDNGERQEQAPKPRRKGRSSTKSILTSTNAEAAVFWQAFFYLLIMLLTWPLLIAGILTAGNDMFAFWATFFFFAPIQGFLKFLLYVRPRVMKWRRERKKLRKQAEKEKLREAHRKEKSIVVRDSPPQDAPLDPQEVTAMFIELKENVETQSMDTPYSSGDESSDGLSDEFNDPSRIYPSLT